jgi:hypothetical protein
MILFVFCVCHYILLLVITNNCTKQKNCRCCSKDCVFYSKQQTIQIFTQFIVRRLSTIASALGPKRTRFDSMLFDCFCSLLWFAIIFFFFRFVLEASSSNNSFCAHNLHFNRDELLRFLNDSLDDEDEVCQINVILVVNRCQPASLIAPAPKKMLTICFAHTICRCCDAQVLLVLTEELGNFVPLVGGADYAYTLLPPLVALASVEVCRCCGRFFFVCSKQFFCFCFYSLSTKNYLPNN